jgi:shikimate dehydrogenase
MFSPISLDDFPDTQAVLDVVYNPARTALMLDAERRGIAAVGGLSMLVAQAAKGFEHFTGDSREEGIIGSVLAQITARSSNIIIVGMPGCGKSSVGAIIADKLGRDFLDADEEFEKMHSITPAYAIRTLGEEKFREMETETISILGKLSGKVIATGGGVVTRERNYPLLHQNGVIVFLERDISLLPTNNRPLSQGNSLEKLYNSRIDSYRRFADITVESTGIIEKTAELIISAFLEFVNKEVSDI